MSHVDADVLLIDEVLAVGDAAFQQKCFDVFHRLKAEGKTILFVTHDMGAAARFCDRAMLLERGRIEAIGAPDMVGARYIQRNFERRQTEDHAPDDSDRVGDRNAEIVEAWFEQDGRRTDVLQQGEHCTFRMRLRFNAELDNPICAFLLEDESLHPLFAVSNEDAGAVTGAHGPGDEATFGVTFRNVFAPGRVYATPWMLHDGGAPIIDRRPRLATAVVTALHRSGGLVDLPISASYERAGERAEA
jgi:Wzt C-terminal domain